MRTVAKIFLVVGLLAALAVIGRSLFIAPGSDDSGVPATAAGASISGESLPQRLIIPRLNIDAKVQHLGITKSGNMAAPSNFTDVSWYKYGTPPGRVGSAVVAGHEDNAISLDGVFKHLEDLENGDDVYVLREDGTKLHFKVVDKQVYPYNLSGPALKEIFEKNDKSRLNLITCAGIWLKEAKTNDKRLVIYTELVK